MDFMDDFDPHDFAENMMTPYGSMRHLTDADISPRVLMIGIGCVVAFTIALIVGINHMMNRWFGDEDDQQTQQQQRSEEDEMDLRRQELAQGHFGVVPSLETGTAVGGG